MCISWCLLNISHLKMHGKYNVKYIHPFSPLSPKYFYLPLFNSVAKRKLLLRRNDIGRGGGEFVPLAPTPLKLRL
jgi:hypothetical protein